MKIILDTNVIIDALSDNFSYTWKIVETVNHGGLQAYASHKIIKEYRLIIKRNVVNENDKQNLEKFIAQVEVANPTKRIKIIEDDPEDDKFIECADEIQANYIISSDAHLLRLEKYKKTQIVEPKDFWLMWENQDDEKWKKDFKDMLGL